MKRLFLSMKIAPFLYLSRNPIMSDPADVYMHFSVHSHLIIAPKIKRTAKLYGMDIFHWSLLIKSIPI